MKHFTYGVEDAEVLSSKLNLNLFNMIIENASVSLTRLYANFATLSVKPESRTLFI